MTKHLPRTLRHVRRGLIIPNIPIQCVNIVIAGLDPAIHGAAPPSSPGSHVIEDTPLPSRNGHRQRRAAMDHRVKPGDDSISSTSEGFCARRERQTTARGQR